jgi:hypothetical protein
MSDTLRLKGDDPPPAADPKTIDVIYERLSGVAESQFGDQANLDGKMVQVFTAASVVMALTGLSAAATTTPIPGVVAVLLGCALAAYAAVATLTGVELRARSFQALRFGSTLWDEEWDQSPEQVKVAVITQVKAAYETNRDILESKATVLFWGIVATGCEVALVAAAIIARTVAS